MSKRFVLILAAVAFFLVLISLKPSGGRADPLTDERFCVDTNGDGKLDLTDAVTILNYLYTGTATPYCIAQNASLDDIYDRLNQLEGAVMTLENHSLVRRTFLPVRCKGLQGTFGVDFVKVADLGTFTKSKSDTLIEAVYSGRISVDSLTDSAGAVFEMRIDDQAQNPGRARVTVKGGEEGIAGVPQTILGAFSGLGAGNHTVSLWVKTLSGTGFKPLVDPGCWDSAQITITETY